MGPPSEDPIARTTSLFPNRGERSKLLVYPGLLGPHPRTSQLSAPTSTVGEEFTSNPRKPKLELQQTNKATRSIRQPSASAHPPNMTHPRSAKRRQDSTPSGPSTTPPRKPAGPALLRSGARPTSKKRKVGTLEGREQGSAKRWESWGGLGRSIAFVVRVPLWAFPAVSVP